MALSGEARAAMAQAIGRAIGADKVIADGYSLRLYQYDAGVETALPDLVVIPTDARDTAAAIRICSSRRYRHEADADSAG